MIRRGRRSGRLLRRLMCCLLKCSLGVLPSKFCRRHLRLMLRLSLLFSESLLLKLKLLLMLQIERVLNIRRRRVGNKVGGRCSPMRRSSVTPS